MSPLCSLPEKPSQDSSLNTDTPTDITKRHKYQKNICFPQDWKGALDWFNEDVKKHQAGLLNSTPFLWCKASHMFYNKCPYFFMASRLPRLRDRPNFPLLHHHWWHMCKQHFLLLLDHYRARVAIGDHRLRPLKAKWTGRFPSITFSWTLGC